MQILIALIRSFIIFFTIIISVNTYAKNFKIQQSLEIKWAEREHRYFGNEGFAKACSETKSTNKYCLNNKIPRKDKQAYLDYGQIILMGDHYLAEDLLFNADDNGDISNHGLQQIMKCIDKQGKVHREQRTRPDVEYPDCEWTIFFNSGNWLGNLLNNIDHFGWYNMKVYVRVHQKALDEAKIAGELQKKGFKNASDFHLRRALYLNGFADHFLTDAFAAGHIRTPRKELKQWGGKNFSGFFKKTQGNLLALAFHDSEAKNHLGDEVGFGVKNSLGNKWLASSDFNLNRPYQESHIETKLIIKSVQLSVVEIFQAYDKGKTPKNLFTAAYLVPFSNEISLEKKFNILIQEEGLEETINKILNFIPSIIRWIVWKKNIALILKNINILMSNFRLEVKKDLKTNSSLKKRLPKAYREAYLKVQ